MARIGRPSEYDEAKAARICERIATSSDGLRLICEQAGIDTHTLYRWLEANEGFRLRYARARSLQCQVLADEIVQIADTPQSGTVTTTKATGPETRTGDMIEHRRLQIDSRKWVLAKLVPHKYGKKIEHTGSDGGPIVHTIRFGDGKRDE